MLYLLAEFDEASEQRLQALHESLAGHGFADRQTPGLPPHITLCGLPDDSDATLARLDKKLVKQSVISVRLGHLGLFGQSVLFVAPNVNEGLLALHRLVDPQPPAACHDWVPHVTMLIDDETHIQKALPILVQGFSPFDAHIARICLYQIRPLKRIGTWVLR